MCVYLCVRVCVTLQLRLTVAEALGLMSHLMAHDKLEEQLSKLLPAVLSLYKKNPEHYIISKVQLLMTLLWPDSLKLQYTNIVSALYLQSWRLLQSMYSFHCICGE